MSFVSEPADPKHPNTRIKLEATSTQPLMTTGGDSGWDTANKILRLLQTFALFANLSIEAYLPKCHSMHRIVGTLCVSAFPYVLICMNFSKVIKKNSFARMTLNIVDQLFCNAFGFVLLDLYLGRNNKCVLSNIRDIWPQALVCFLFFITYLMNTNYSFGLDE